MEIRKLNGYEAQAVQRTTEQQQTRRASEESAPGKEVTSGSDQVKLSSHYQEMAQVRKVMMEREELRSERVDHLRNMIENNSYVVDPEKTAQRMLEELW
jgi:negative regulator of flagellin synthesis FlgM